MVLLQEEMVTVDADGRRVMRERGAIKILQTGGESIEAGRSYNTKNGRIRDFQGWLISPSGKAVPYAKNRVIDVALSRDYVYDEARAGFECGAAAPGIGLRVGSNRGRETVFTQSGFSFQQQPSVRFPDTSEPARRGGAGYRVQSRKLEPQVSGGAYTWELRNLPD